ncbi:MAG: galactokinase [Lactobacillaceae bacterium]|jgi:galactokinase|nr:galactokinase [Lactobacillaceae bacterium]
MPEEIYTTLTKTFTEKFGQAPAHRFFSPGRINLIGEHTDYNGGYVFPAAITLGTYGVAANRTDNLVKLYSLNFADQGVIEFDINDTNHLPHGSWGNFVKGVIIAMRGFMNEFDHGFELVISGDLPNASGLSSSSSLELLIGVVLKRLFNLPIPRLQMVVSGQLAENGFVGVNTGIMDQFAVGFGEKDKAIYMDANSLDYQMVPVELGDYVIVIMNTNKRRELADSKYNERVAQTQEALHRLQQKFDIVALGKIDPATFDANTALIGDEILIKRARHAVYENERTKEAVSILKAGDLVEFGKLLNASHESLKTDYAVTGIELDTLAETAQQVPGCLGARMTGAGFGGTAIALVHKDAVEELEKTVGERYTTVVGYAPSFYVASIGDGAKALD